MGDLEKNLLQQLEAVYPKGEATAIANLVLSHFTGLNRMQRRLQAEMPCEPAVADCVSSAQLRLMQQEPVQYVLGEAWFDGHRFFVNKSVLIPRPETEELVDWISQDLKQAASLQVLDIGTGSGCIPISLKMRYPLWQVHAADLSTEALDVAKKNAVGLGAEVTFHLCDFLNEAERACLPEADVLVSNPPYITQGEAAQMDTHVVAWEPAMALFVPNYDPLVFYKAIEAFAQTHLKPQGNVFLECHQHYTQEVTAYFWAKGWKAEARKDISGNWRMVRCGL